jgi:hypothetical protein
VEEAHGAERVRDEQVRVPVAVNVPRRDPGRRDSFGRRLREAGLLRDVGEPAGAVVAIQDRARAVGDE